MAIDSTTRKKKKLGSYPFVSVIFSIALALLVVGLFGALVIYAKELERVVREQVRVQVYLKSGLSPVQIQQLQKNLSARYFIAKDAGANAITFVSKDEAAKQFVKETGEDFLQFLGENPLRDAFLIQIDRQYQNPTSFQKLKAEIEAINGVFQVYYVESLLESINKNTSTIAFGLMGLAAVLLILVVLLINNTIRLALFSQRFIIRSMQLVGATRGFIQSPFLWRSALYGFIAGILAACILAALLAGANQRLEGLQLLQNNERLFILLGALTLLGIFVAVLSTTRAIAKYLHQSLDDLY
jgi:cell division transport system permease protein